jgi:hypothetical protein
LIRHLRQNPQIEESIHTNTHILALLKTQQRQAISTRSAADIIGATQADEDFERDSLASQSSRTTARIRLQEKYVKVATLYKDECTPEEIKERIREIAFNAVVKSAIYEDLDPADKAYGVFKKKLTASPPFLSAYECCFPECILHFAAISIHVQKEPVCA